MVSLTFRPSRPPWAFTSLAHSLYPFAKACPSAEKSPVLDSDAPMVIGPADPADVAVLWPGPPPEQAARTLAASTARALLAKVLLRNWGWPGLTPSPPNLNRLHSYTSGYTGLNHRP